MRFRRFADLISTTCRGIRPFFKRRTSCIVIAVCLAPSTIVTSKALFFGRQGRIWKLESWWAKHQIVLWWRRNEAAIIGDPAAVPIDCSILTYPMCRGPPRYGNGRRLLRLFSVRRRFLLFSDILAISLSPLGLESRRRVLLSSRGSFDGLV